VKDSELKVILSALREAERLAEGRLAEVKKQMDIAQQEKFRAHDFMQAANALAEQISNGEKINAKKDAAFESLFCALADLVVHGKTSEQADWDAASKALNEGSAFRGDCK
jgi:flagellar motor switch protein FliM